MKADWRAWVKPYSVTFIYIIDWAVLFPQQATIAETMKLITLGEMAHNTIIDSTVIPPCVQKNSSTGHAEMIAFY